MYEMSILNFKNLGITSKMIFKEIIKSYNTDNIGIRFVFLTSFIMCQSIQSQLNTTNRDLNEVHKIAGPREMTGN